MNTKQHPKTDIAALSYSIDLSKSYVQITPDGLFKSRDGRPENMDGVTVKNWQMSNEIAERLIASLSTRKDDIVIDYEHQTLNSEKNGKPAPASGWIKPDSFRYEAGVGLVAPVKWTQTALNYIKNDEYRHISPVIEFNSETGEVVGIAHIALTNYAAVDGMKAVAALRAQRTASQDPPTTNKEDNTMDKEKLIVLLGLASDASEEVIETALKAVLADKQTLAALRSDLGIKDGEDSKTAIAALKAGSKPDLTQYAPLKVVEELKTQVAALTAQANVGELDGLITDALNNGKLIAAQEDWARDLGKSDIAALKGYLDKTPAIAALKTTQTKDKQPNSGVDLSAKAAKLSEDEGISVSEAMARIKAGAA